MEAKLKFKTMLGSKNSNLMMTYYAFKAVVDYLKSNKDLKVEDLKLKVGDEVLQTEVAFREFLTRVSALGYNEENLDSDEIRAINLITEYLSTPFIEERAKDENFERSIREQIESQEPKN